MCVCVRVWKLPFNPCTLCQIRMKSPVRWEGGGPFAVPADGLRTCWQGAVTRACVPPLLILKIKYIIFDFLFISHPLHPLYFFPFLSFSGTGHLPIILQVNPIIYIKGYGLSSCKNQKERSPSFHML